MIVLFADNRHEIGIKRAEQAVELCVPDSLDGKSLAKDAVNLFFRYAKREESAQPLVIKTEHVVFPARPQDFLQETCKSLSLARGEGMEHTRVDDSIKSLAQFIDTKDIQLLEVDVHRVLGSRFQV